VIIPPLELIKITLKVLRRFHDWPWIGNEWRFDCLSPNSSWYRQMKADASSVSVRAIENPHRPRVIGRGIMTPLSLSLLLLLPRPVTISFKSHTLQGVRRTSIYPSLCPPSVYNRSPPVY